MSNLERGMVYVACCQAYLTSGVVTESPLTAIASGVLATGFFVTGVYSFYKHWSANYDLLRIPESR